jgi:hypothetical protein
MTRSPLHTPSRPRSIDDQLISQFKTQLERVTRQQSIAWWFEYNGSRSRLSSDQRAKVIAVNKQLEEK